MLIHCPNTIETEMHVSSCGWAWNNPEAVNEGQWNLNRLQSRVLGTECEDVGESPKRRTIELITQYDAVVSRNIVEGRVAAKIICGWLPCDQRFKYDIDKAKLEDLCQYIISDIAERVP